ncbi:MAG: DUF805 domain-containing protein [Bacteroidales bacterium]|nr:DUF805 domain-containing protein [Candidatus Colimorpha merdihippi]
MKYFIEKNGKQLGPYDQDMIRSMYRDGMLDSGCHVWREGFETWQPIEVINQEPGAETAATEEVPPPTSYFGAYDSNRQPEVGVNDARPPYSPYAYGETRTKKRARMIIPSYNLGSAIASCMKRYVQFEGRACRSEYWFWVLAYWIIKICILGIIYEQTNPDGLSAALLFERIFELITMLPSLAVAVRRIHDTGHSGWFILVPIYNIILLFSDTQRKPNEYGQAPLPPDK